MDDIVTLAFHNRTAAGYGFPQANQEMRIERSAAHTVAKWYGGYCGGDDYDVLVDRVVVEKDINGEIDPLG